MADIGKSEFTDVWLSPECHLGPSIQPSSLPSTLREQTAPHKAWNLPAQSPGALPAAPTRWWRGRRPGRGATRRARPRRRHDSGARSRRQVSLGAEAALGQLEPRPGAKARSGAGSRARRPGAWGRLALGPSPRPAVPCAAVSDAPPWSAMLALCSSSGRGSAEGGAAGTQ